VINDGEDNFSREAQAVMATLRTEMERGRIPKEHAEFLADAVKLKDSIGILSNFIIKLAAFVGAMSVIYTFWWRK
jgi:hypothetical protein